MSSTPESKAAERTDSGAAPEPANYVTSPGLDSGWPGSALTDYVFLVCEGQGYIGIDQGVYLCSAYPKERGKDVWQTVPPELRAELDAWDAASDEALANFEKSLE